ncbi:MAG: RHS repeat protein, partial [Phycisphaeraceae bacterium]|nr:RHS repeat protein [Phycisphaeraceae bacterium]
MISENPILIIDSALADVTGDNPRTCWLILDAHHSIPFQQIESNGTYEAPPRFRARMTHNGDWDAANRTWYDNPAGPIGEQHPPTQYEISLYDGAVKYTFVAIREDVPPHEYDENALDGSLPESLVDSHYHRRPYTPNQALKAGRPDPWDLPRVDPTTPRSNPGLGLPYYGLCVKIEDRHGHKVEINYCPVEQFELDNSDTTCIEWGQTTNRKGQINYIQLISPGDTGDTVEWTLVYSHRRFLTRQIGKLPDGWLSWIRRDHPLSPLVPGNEHKYEMYSHVALDRIYVYEGEPTGNLDDAQLSLPHTDLGYYEGGADPIVGSTLDASKDDWRYLVRYHYLKEGHPPAEPTSTPFVPLQIRTSVTSRAEVSGTLSERSTVYVYKTGSPVSATQTAHPDVSNSVELPWLHLVFTDEDIRHLKDALQDGPVIPWSEISVYDLAHWYEPGSSSPSKITDPQHEDAIKRWASVELSAPPSPPEGNYLWSNGVEPNSKEPLASVMVSTGSHGQYFTRARERLVCDKNPAAVVEAAIRDENGVKRFYRIFRVWHVPPDVASSAALPDGDPFWLNPTDHRIFAVGYTQPMRSVYAHPFQWHGYTPEDPVAGGNTNLANFPLNLKDPLWIAVVDEFNSREAMISRGTHNGVNYDSMPYGGEGTAGTKPGQLSRQIIEVSPSGYVLKERRWEYTADGISVYGGGLGEEFIYETVDDYFTAGEIPAAIPPTTHGTPADPKHPDQLDPWKSVRNELLLVERRSVGWSVADLVDRDPLNPAGQHMDPEPGPVAQQNGLIHFYEYDVLARGVVVPGGGGEPDFETVPANARVQLVAEGIKKGTLAQTPLYTRQLFRNDARPTEVLCEVEFTSPTICLLSVPPDYTSQSPAAGIRATHFVSQWDTTEILATTEQPVTSRLVVGPPRQVRPNSGWYYPIEWEHYDEDGSSDWSAVGQLFDPSNPGAAGTAPYDSVTLTYYVRDDKGRSLYTVVDTEPGSYPTPDGESVSVPAVPDGWARVPPTGALNYVTAFKYGQHGLSDIFYPSGLRWARRVVKAFDPEANPPEEFAREFIFNNLEKVDGTSDPVEFVPRSPGEVRDYPTPELRGNPLIKRRVEYLYTDSAPLDFLDDIDRDVSSSRHPAWQELWELKIAPDANGRLQNVELLEPDPTGAMLAVGSKEVNDLGEVHRTREIDGSITRLTKDSVGQVLRTYVGTEDFDWPAAPVGMGFNMILTERYEYGSSINDAWQPISIRTYCSMPSWHIPLGKHATGGTVGYYDNPPDIDPDGIATITGYDWRMRPVRVDSYEKGDPSTAPRLSTTLTWLDHADRPRLVVTFGKGDISGAPDPTTVTPGQELAGTAIPSLTQLYSLALKPTSITEMFYGPDGSMTERRTYDMEAAGGSPPPYLAEFSYSGKGGQRVYNQQPGQPIQINKLDGVGRVSQSRTVLPGGESTAGMEYELSRTDYEYDANGNAKDVKVWTRVAMTGEALDPSNAVRTRTVNWYDVEKRLVATAELGTEEDTFSPTTSEWTYVDSAPSATYAGADVTGANRGPLPEGVPFWVYVYDKRGNQTHIVDPDGRVTKFEYSGSGRHVQKIENAAAANPNMIRATEYKHQYGRLTEMATLDTNVTGVGQDQRTIVTYGADIVDVDFNVMSRSNALIGALSIQGGPTDPIFPDSFRIRYTFQGQIAEREDQRGVVFRYGYDDLARLVSIQVGHRDTSGAFALGYPASMTSTVGDPVDRIEMVEYQYDDAGNLKYVTNWGASSTLISQNEYMYDARGTLLAEWQAIGEAVSASTPYIAYAWDYEPTDITTAAPGGTPSQVGFLRLTEMAYPQVPGKPIRRITMDYGAAGGDGDVLSRLDRMTSNLGEPTIAEFGYFGASRRKSLTLGGSSAGGGVRQSLDIDTGSVGLEGLDTYGRVADLHYKNGASTPATLFRGEYTYDILGNRRTSRLTQAPVGAVSQINIFSQLNSYDELNRLVKTEYGTLGFTGSPAVPVISPLVRTDEWSLDLLGNWVGGAAAGTTGPPEGRRIDGNLDWFGYSPPRGVDLGGITPDAGNDTLRFTQIVTFRNEIEDLKVDLDAGTLSQKPTQYDAAGNLVFDGDYYYQYDAWNRLIQVNEATWVSEQVDIGNIVKHYTYDGHGRLIRIQSPYPQPGAIPDDDFRTERLYYDGI